MVVASQMDIRKIPTILWFHRDVALILETMNLLNVFKYQLNLKYFINF